MNFIEVPIQSKSIQICNRFKCTLVNESCHILFGDRDGIVSFLAGNLDDNCLILECLKRLDDLIDEMNNLKFEKVLNTLIITNLSWVIWELKIINKENWQQYKLSKFISYYDRLNRFSDAIDTIKDIYKCNVIILSYDIQFDKGFNFEKFVKVDDSSQDLASFTNMPINYLLKLNHLFHVDEKSNYRIFDFQQKKWITR